MTTENDRAVLSRILNPLLPAEYGIDNIDENIVDDASSDQKNDDNEQVLAAKQLEIEAIQLAESGQIDAAIDMLNRAIDQCPQRASAYNNRAQALRIKGNVDAALVDLNKAIELLNDSTKSDKKTAIQAYTQRAMIARLQNRDHDAKRDYELAAALGSSFAKMQLVTMNPYAAMCNKMLAQVIDKLQRGEPTDQHSDTAA